MKDDKNLNFLINIVEKLRLHVAYHWDTEEESKKLAEIILSLPERF